MKRLDIIFLLISTIFSLVILGTVICIAVDKLNSDKTSTVWLEKTVVEVETEAEEPTETEVTTIIETEIKIEEEQESTEESEKTKIQVEFPYYIKVNRKMNTITVYEIDETGEYSIPIKAMICSTGGGTPLGIYSSKKQYEMKALFKQVYGQYATVVVGQVLIHSVPSRRATKDTLIPSYYNLLGTKASMGCIRLTVRDAKWIYDNCKIGTTIEIYDDEDPGPLGKPVSIKVPSYTTWDPTDPDPNNPWHEYHSTIESIRVKPIEYGESLNIKEMVKALDTCGNDITELITIEGNIDVNIPGDYTLTYKVEDAIGSKVSLTVTYTVVESIYNQMIN
ncbi:MAG: L,D-transpeptidase family protein [Clostridiales bacterium]|nr:L,D-transpeptidase family protein [Clostridiales bacterium]